MFSLFETSSDPFPHPGFFWMFGGRWRSRARRALLSHRHTQHIYACDSVSIKIKIYHRAQLRFLTTKFELHSSCSVHALHPHMWLHPLLLPLPSIHEPHNLLSAVAKHRHQSHIPVREFQINDFLLIVYRWAVAWRILCACSNNFYTDDIFLL